MWLHFYGVFSVLWTFLYLECKANNANFNDQIREYVTTDVGDNLIHDQVKTLQKQSIGLGRYASSAPVQNPIKFKEVPDSALSGSSHSRGLLHHEHSGYGYTDYDEPHYGHGFEYSPDHHYGFHDIGHHHIGGHHGYGHGHHKHYDHALATKSLLWPIAGIALLGAAAALVTNPVLLQLGVVSGRRRRRHTDVTNFFDDSLKRHTDTSDYINTPFKKWNQNSDDNKVNETDAVLHKVVKKSVLRKADMKKNNFGKQNQVLPKPKYVQSSYLGDYNHDSKQNDDDVGRRFIPILLKYKHI